MLPSLSTKPVAHQRGRWTTQGCSLGQRHAVETTVHAQARPHGCHARPQTEHADEKLQNDHAHVAVVRKLPDHAVVQETIMPMLLL